MECAYLWCMSHPKLTNKRLPGTYQNKMYMTFVTILGGVPSCGTWQDKGNFISWTFCEQKLSLYSVGLVHVQICLFSHIISYPFARKAENSCLDLCKPEDTNLIRRLESESIKDHSRNHMKDIFQCNEINSTTWYRTYINLNAGRLVLADGEQLPCSLECLV